MAGLIQPIAARPRRFAGNRRRAPRLHIERLADQLRAAPGVRPVPEWLREAIKSVDREVRRAPAEPLVRRHGLCP